MTAPRKKWAVSLAPGQIRRQESKAAAYRTVSRYAGEFAAGMLRYSRATVWVDEGLGRGWQAYESVDLREVRS